MGKIIIFYKYVDIAHPHELVSQQRQLCEELGLKGRIIIAHEGINGTLGGTKEATELYKKHMATHVLFSDVDIKESEGEADHFPRLKVIFKKEIVHFGIDPEIVNARDAGIALSPQEVHELLENKSEDFILLDARNNYESRVGAFKEAITPNINYFREFPQYIDENLEHFKDKQVLMYCTAGVRCERATAYLLKKGVAKNVYHMKGGIHKYVETYPDGHFKGKNYVFDGRITQKVTNDVLSTCEHCKKSFDEYSNCINAECNKQIIVCTPCMEVYHNTCSTRCLELVQSAQVTIRTIPHKILIPAQKR